MPSPGWLMAGFAFLGSLVTWVAHWTGLRARVASHGIRLDKHGEKLDAVVDDIKVIRDGIGEIRESVARIEGPRRK